MWEKAKDWLFIVTAIGAGMYLASWLHTITLAFMKWVTYVPPAY